MEKKAETVLKFVPKSYPLSFSELSERIHRFAPEIQDHELTDIVEELVREGFIYEPQPGEYQKVITEIKKSEEEKSETKEKPKPLYKAYFPLGEGQGISITLWQNNLQLQRRERDEGGNWTTTQEIALAKSVLEKLYIRLPMLFEKMKEV